MTNNQDLIHVDWEDILETLKAQKCVLFIGSGAYKAPDGGDIDTALTAWLDKINLEKKYIHLHSPDGFILLRKEQHKRKVVRGLKRFYNQSFPETEQEFKKLAQIPFSVIFSLTHDNILTQTFDDYGFKYQYDFYSSNPQTKKTSQFKPPTKKRPLIYNLLGTIDIQDSMVLTHSDFFHYLESMFRGHKINPELIDHIEDAQRFIFLGLPYEKWYFQLLLRIISMHSDKLSKIERLGLKEFENPELYKLYEKEFKIDFIPTDISFFINELHSQCEKNALLKEIPFSDMSYGTTTGTNYLEEHVIDLIADAKISEAIFYIKSFLIKQETTNEDLVQELILVLRKYSLLNKRQTTNVIEYEDFIREFQEIIISIIKINSKVANI